MGKGAVFFDYDGTLAADNRQIHLPLPSTIAALKQLKENGYLVGLATGRGKWYVPKIDFAFDCYVTSNGAYAEYHGEPIWNDTFPLDLLNRFCAFAKEAGISVVVEEQDADYSDDRDDPVLIEMAEAFHLPLEQFRPLPPLERLKVNKMFITYDTTEKLERARAAFAGELDIAAHHSVSISADVAKQEINKAVGIEKVLSRLHIAREDTYVFGDGENDAGMFRLAGTAVAMKDHSAALDPLAAYITESVQNDGIARGLKHLGLIN